MAHFLKVAHCKKAAKGTGFASHEQRRPIARPDHSLGMRPSSSMLQLLSALAPVLSSTLASDRSAA